MSPVLAPAAGSLLLRRGALAAALVASVASGCLRASSPAEQGWLNLDAPCEGTGSLCLVPLAQGQATNGTLAIGGERVYFDTIGSVVAMPLQGGAITTVASTSGTVTSLAADSRNVYFTSDPVDSNSSSCGGVGPGVAPIGGAPCTSQTLGPGDVSSVPFAGGAVTTLASSQNDARLVAVDSTSVYWTRDAPSNPDGGLPGPDALISVPIGGGVATTLASGFDDIHTAVDSHNVYSCGFQGTLLQQPFGGAPITLAQLDDQATAIAVDQANVYVATLDDDLYAVPIGGGTVATLLQGEAVTSLGSDGANLYLGGTGGLMQMSVDGGPVTTFDRVWVTALAVGDAGVVWLDWVAGPSASSPGTYELWSLSSTAGSP
ncbi:MAG: hypothetical protein ACLQVI_02635 [Polyangiaceae bacterium]